VIIEPSCEDNAGGIQLQLPVNASYNLAPSISYRWNFFDLATVNVDAVAFYPGRLQNSRITTYIDFCRINLSTIRTLNFLSPPRR
jgi:hypothetical protein